MRKRFGFRFLLVHLYAPHCDGYHECGCKNGGIRERAGPCVDLRREECPFEVSVGMLEYKSSRRWTESDGMLGSTAHTQHKGSNMLCHWVSEFRMN